MMKYEQKKMNQIKELQNQLEKCETKTVVTRKGMLKEIYIGERANELQKEIHRQKWEEREKRISKRLKELKAETAENHSGDMYKQYSNNPELKQKGRLGRFNWTPYTPIPNCADFEITLRGDNTVLKEFGISKANEPEMKFEG